MEASKLVIIIFAVLVFATFLFPGITEGLQVLEVGDARNRKSRAATANDLKFLNFNLN